MPKIQRRHFLGLFLFTLPVLFLWKKKENDSPNKVVDEYQRGEFQYLDGWSYSISELTGKKQR